MFEKQGPLGAVIASVAVVATFALFAVVSATPQEIRGEKLEEGIQVAHGTITQMSSIHGRDWHMRIDNGTFSFEFPWGTFDCDNNPEVGDNIAVAYEWRLRWHDDCAAWDEEYYTYPYWAPVVLDWEVV